MKIIAKEKGFELQQVRESFYQVIDRTGSSWGYRHTLKTAQNLFKKILSCY